MQSVARRRPGHDHARTAVLVTDAQVAGSVEREDRQRRYLISMGIRTVCFVLAVVLFRGVAQLVAIGVSMVMPWVAVLVANAGPRRRTEHPAFFLAPRPRALTAAPQPSDEKSANSSSG